jgi:hypothetical protein
MRVLATVQEIELEGDYDDTIPSICVTCSRCDHSVKVFGQGPNSIRRGMATLHDECPMDENNFYAEDAS